jgi:hypothetical protein
MNPSSKGIALIGTVTPDHFAPSSIHGFALFGLQMVQDEHLAFSRVALEKHVVHCC